MTQGIHQLTASMVNQLNRVDVVSNNLANSNTVGFKAHFFGQEISMIFIKKGSE